MCVHVWGCSAASTGALSVKVSPCCQGLSLQAAGPACHVCEADGKVDLKWTGNGNRRRVFSLAEGRMESSLVDWVHFICMIPCGRMCCIVFKLVLTFFEGDFSLWLDIKPVLNWNQFQRRTRDSVRTYPLSLRWDSWKWSLGLLSFHLCC